MSKATKIRGLFAGGHLDQQIADAVGCGTAYVRTVRQRVIKPHTVWSKYGSQRYFAGDRAAAICAGRKARTDARAKGRSEAESVRAANTARKRVMRHTGKVALTKLHAGDKGQRV